MENELDRAVRSLCLSFPETEALISHGSPNFRVRGSKIFATYSVNHHGDGRIALWLNVPEGIQQSYATADPKHFFVPPYVGPRGWLGVRLDLGLDWQRIVQLVRMAYERVAPPRLRQALDELPQIPAPASRVSARDLDPMTTPRGRRLLAAMRSICLKLPESSEGLQFGRPVWRAGKRTFAQLYCREEQWRAVFWVGVHAQAMMTQDPRYTIPAYFGHRGWIALDVSDGHRLAELRSLALSSYRHFALQRMLVSLEPRSAYRSSR